MLFKAISKQALFIKLFTIIFILTAVGLYAQEQIQIVDNFENLKVWNQEMGDDGTATYSSAWKTEGNTSLKLSNTTTNNQWICFKSEEQAVQSPDQIRVDLKNGNSVQHVFKVEVLDYWGNSRVLGTKTMAANTEYLNVTFTNTSPYAIAKMRLIQDQYGTSNVITYIDNIRFVTGGTPTVWDPCETQSAEDHYTWRGVWDAERIQGKTDNSGFVTETMHSPNLGSTASIIMEWDATVSGGASAELEAREMLYDLSPYTTYSLDVYRPAGTNSNIEVKVWSYSQSMEVGYLSEGVKINAADTWTTINIPISGEQDTRTSISQLNIIVQQTDVYTTGLLYFDNFRAREGGIFPEAAPQNPSTIGNYVHMLKDYDDLDLKTNKFYGDIYTGQDQATISQQISSPGYNASAGALRIDYNVTTQYSYAYYQSKLGLNSVKDKLVIYMKGESANPGTVKLELHDINWEVNGGGAYCLLRGINTSWQQWIVSLDPADLIINENGYDPDNITEVVVVLNNGTAESKTGAFYIDDIIFIDETDEFTAYDGFVLPQSTPVTPSGYEHTLKDYNDGSIGGNDFYGQNGAGGDGSVTQTISESIAYTGSALQIDYDVSAENTFIYYNLSLGLNSDKDKMVLYLRGSSDNPEIVKVELKYGLGENRSAAFYYLTGLSSTQWKQWVLPLDEGAHPTPYDPAKPYDPTCIDEIVIAIENRKAQDKVGTLYVDDIIFFDDADQFTAYPGYVLPQASPITPPGYKHGLKDYNDNILMGNDFYGMNGAGGNGAVNQEITGTAAYNGSALKLDYDVSELYSFIYYNNMLRMNSNKDKLVLYLKAEEGNPGIVKLEIKYWTGDVRGTSYYYLPEISSTEWQQWVIPLSAGEAHPTPYEADKPYDPTKIDEIVISVENVAAKGKAGVFYIDEIAFYDSDDNLEAYPGLILPESSPITPTAYAHPVKDYTEGQLVRNRFYGRESFGNSAVYVEGTGWVANSEVESQISETEYYTQPSLQIDYNVDSLWSYIYYSNKLSYNSNKDKMVLYMKGGTNNPRIAKLEIKYGSGENTGSGYYCLGEISSTEWRQWVVPLKLSEQHITIYDPENMPPYDPENIYEVVVAVENVSAKAMDGTFYIDDIVFFDSDDILTPYPGFLPEPEPGEVLISANWDDPSQWVVAHGSGNSASLSDFPGLNGDGIIMDYDFSGGGWANMKKAADFDPRVNPMAFFIKPNKSDNLEIKFIDTDGSIFGKTVSLYPYDEWMRMVIYSDDMRYWYSGDNTFGTLDTVEIAVAGGGSTSIWLDEIGIAPAGTPSTFGPVLDPDSTLPGIGFAQRRAASMIAEDPLVIEYLKVLQDNSSADQKLVPSQEGDAIPRAQTFNNSLVAMAFILKGEKERAERILDFYSDATDVGNMDIKLQNFYYNGEARGFYQQVNLDTYRDEEGHADRWMGDMAWLLCTYNYYEGTYGAGRYTTIIGLLKDLLVSFYTSADVGGYIQSGWRNGDSYLHEPTGHPEGNIDAYAVMKMFGEDAMAQNIKDWIENELTTKQNNNNLYLDLYTWRVLAYGADYVDLLNIPEYDLRYRKKLYVNADSVAGLYSEPDIWSNNIWVDGTGHIACAYLAYGDQERGYFYSNQLDALIIEKDLYGSTVHTLPYAANKEGVYGWVDTEKGFVSCAAWYIFAKNEFNPFDQVPGAKEKMHLDNFSEDTTPDYVWFGGSHSYDSENEWVESDASGSPYYVAMNYPANAADVTVQTDFYFTANTNNYASMYLFARVTPSTDPGAEDAYCGKIDVKKSSGASYLRIYRCKGGSWTSLVYSSIVSPPPPNEWHTAKMSVIGNEIKLYMDGNLLYSYTDNSPSAITAPGDVSIQPYRELVYVDNVTCYMDPISGINDGFATNTTANYTWFGGAYSHDADNQWINNFSNSSPYYVAMETNDLAAADVAVSADFSFTSSYYGYATMFTFARVTPGSDPGTQNSYLGIIGLDGGSSTSNYWSGIWKTVNGSWTKLSSYDTDVPKPKLNEWHRQLLVVEGNSIKLYLDNRLVASIEDNSVPAAGDIAIQSTYGDANTDQLCATVWSIGPIGKAVAETGKGSKFPDGAPDNLGNNNDPIPTEYSLNQNYPNPFNPSTTIKYALPQTGYVKLTVYNILGELIAELVNTQKDAGYYQVNFDGSKLANGIYFYRMEAGNYVKIKKMMIIK